MGEGQDAQRVFQNRQLQPGWLAGWLAGESAAVFWSTATSEGLREEAVPRPVCITLAHRPRCIDQFLLHCHWLSMSQVTQVRPRWQQCPYSSPAADTQE